MDNDTINNSGSYFICGICNLKNILTNCKNETFVHEIIVISLYVLKYGNLQTKLSSKF